MSKKSSKVPSHLIKDHHASVCKPILGPRLALGGVCREGAAELVRGDGALRKEKVKKVLYSFTNLTLGGGQADCEVRSHVEPCQHYTLVISKLKVDRTGVCGVH